MQSHHVAFDDRLMLEHRLRNTSIEGRHQQIRRTALDLLVGQWAKRPNRSLRFDSSLVRLMTFVGLLLLASSFCWAIGHPLLAMIIAGAPPLIVGTLFGAWCLLLVTMRKNARWN